MKFGIKSVAAALLAGLVLTGCGQKEESKVLKVG
ncbi:MAG: methionine ABC transporter membrane-anchored lipoprotein MetQ, partial [Aeromonas sobria]